MHKFAGIGIDDYNGDKVAMLNTVQASFSKAWWVKAKGSSQSSKFCLNLFMLLNWLFSILKRKFWCRMISYFGRDHFSLIVVSAIDRWNLDVEWWAIWWVGLYCKSHSKKWGSFWRYDYSFFFSLFCRRFLSKIFEIDLNLTFLGIQIICCGDFLQIPPVSDKSKPGIALIIHSTC